MSEKVGHSVLPISRPEGGSWNKRERNPIDAPLESLGTPNTHEVIIHCFIYIFIKKNY